MGQFLPDGPDVRISGYPLMSTPWPTFFLCLLYFYVVKSALPRFMENRKPYEIRTLMIWYNFAMVALSGYICFEMAINGWLADYSLGCQPVDTSNSPQATRMLKACWLFYFSKNIELLDTVFFLLRKKTSHVTFLHVFHHGMMPISFWFGMKYVPGGSETFAAMLNSFIHFVMYTYYGLSAFGPRFQKYLWWKRYMTRMQIIQFLMMISHSLPTMFIECDYPRVFALAIIGYASIFLVLFSNFYIQAYRRQKRTANGAANGTAGKAVNGTTVNGTTVNGTTVNGTTVNGTAVNGTAVNGTAVNGTAVNGTTVNGTAVNGTTVNGTAVNGTTVNGTTVNGVTLNGTVIKNMNMNGHGAMANGMTVIRTQSNGTIINGSTRNGRGSNGTTASNGDAKKHQ